MTDPFAQALYDYHFDERTGPIRYRNGEETREADLDLYFREQGSGDEEGKRDRRADGDDGVVGDDRTDGDDESEEPWLDRWLDGPLIDLGAGAGRHALHYQERFETVAVDHHDLLVEVMADRGVVDARVADMFSLREAFDRDRFRCALAVGTQVGLSGSMAGLREFLGDLAHVTTPGGTAVFDGFDPTHELTREMLEFRPDPTPGLAYRVIQFEYDGVLGEPWLYRLFTPDRIREATIGTDWTVAEVRYGDDDWANVYNVALEKR